jgi:hypothetical protein
MQYALLSVKQAKPVLRSDRGVLSLNIIDQQQFKRLRSIKSDIGENANSIILYGGINIGQKVQVCIAQPEQIVDEVYRVVDLAQQQGLLCTAGIIISLCRAQEFTWRSILATRYKAIRDNFGH